MIQLYFLSILCNGLSGYILFAGDENEPAANNIFSGVNPAFILALGILSGVTGILKLLSPTMDGLPILGDLIPAAAGIIAGLLLIFGIYRKENSSVSQKTLDIFCLSLLRFRKPIGLVLLGTALLHFLLPQAIFI